MLSVLIGAIGLPVVAFLFWTALPRKDGTPRWFVGTRWEPYVVVGMVFVIGMSVVLILSGLSNLSG
jgi:hypothetical protein